MIKNRRSSLVGGALGAVLVLGLVGCSGGHPTATTPDEVKKSAIRLLKETQRQVDLDWPATPAPSAEKCTQGGVEGVRFSYYVPVRVETDTAVLARRLQSYWESKGLVVNASHEDFGGGDGILYSATADKDGAAGAAYQLSDVAVVIQITSPCAEGSASDYE